MLRERNRMFVAERVHSIVYAPLFHRGCTFALKHMCTEFYDANHASIHGTKVCHVAVPVIAVCE